MASLVLRITLFSLALVHVLSGVTSRTFTIVNKCEYTVWPGILSSGGVPPLSTTGFALQKGESKTITAPTSWGGRFWGRTHCSQDSTGKFSCVTGDCGSGKIECSGNGGALPATLAQFTHDGAGGFDFFDVSLVDGYNLAMLVVPQGGTGQNCTSIGCLADLNDSCPSELQVTSADADGNVACKSACQAFGQPQYCCNGAYGSPNTCKPSTYSQIFKSACPQAYSYAYDDKTSTFTCASADYTISFCPTPNTRHPPITTPSSPSNSKTASSPSINNTTKSSQSTDTHESVATILWLVKLIGVSTLLRFMEIIWQLSKFLYEKLASKRETTGSNVETVIRSHDVEAHLSLRQIHG